MAPPTSFASSLRASSSLFAKYSPRITQKSFAYRMATQAAFKVPKVSNEPNVCKSFEGRINRYTLKLNEAVQKHYAKGATDRQKLADAIAAFKKQSPLDVPLVVAGKQVSLRVLYFGIAVY